MEHQDSGLTSNWEGTEGLILNVPGWPVGRPVCNSWWWYSGDTGVIQGWYRGDIVLIQWWYGGDTVVVIQWWYGGDTVVIRWWYSGDTIVIQWWYNAYLWIKAINYQIVNRIYSTVITVECWMKVEWKIVKPTTWRSSLEDSKPGGNGMSLRTMTHIYLFIEEWFGGGMMNKVWSLGFLQAEVGPYWQQYLHLFQSHSRVWLFGRRWRIRLLLTAVLCLYDWLRHSCF